MIKNRFYFIISVIIVTVLISVFALSGAFKFFDREIVDFITVNNLQEDKAGKKDIAYAMISDFSLKMVDKFYKMGWPWRRKMYGKLAEFTRICGAKSTIFDFHFTERSVFKVSQNRPYRAVDDDSFFAKRIKSNGKVILSYQKRTRADKSKNLKWDKLFFRKSIEVIKKDNSIKINSYLGIYGPILPLLNASAGVGCVNTFLEEDGFARGVKLLFSYQGKYYPGLSLATYMQVKGLNKIILENSTIKVGKIAIPVDDSGYYRIKFYGDNNVYYDFDLLYMFLALDKIKRHYALYQKLIPGKDRYSVEDICQDKAKYSAMLKLLNAKRGKLSPRGKKVQPLTIPVVGLKRWKKDGKIIKRELLYPWTVTGKAIFVGSIASGLQDIWPSPLNRHETGVHFHATAFDNMLQRDFLSVVDSNFIYILFTLIFVLLTSWVSYRLAITRAAFISFVLFVIPFVLSWLMFSVGNLIFYPFSGMVAVAFSFVIITVLRRSIEKRQNSYLKEAFGQYLSPAVIKIILDNPDMLKLGGDRRKMTAFFSDLEGFSSIAESLSPEELVIMLNDYLTRMCDIILKYEGTIDKFEGDAIVAFWGAPLEQPNHALLACQAAVEMQEVMVEMREEYRLENKPQFYMRIGINTGFMVVGNMGSNHRMDYTIMGDAVNLAARLEGANKNYKTYTMVSENTYQFIKNKLVARELDCVRVMGKKEPVTVYELVTDK